ncbi:uncharacterized protein B0H18DRAFT_1209027 [Fomitopsis serialis]|uniref:uncharacterized protein n=1 Tax=Fomitopsis serialis TaxID=139415 RepID=UPI00200819B8|nr:uncharacterized protein B0H18DRAFT_1209027 [Neoantrodia serialis]KAH9931352.1 hypothetical protein B0H18DRAFT_1209027 [Neoantrodia serialis]
MPVPTHARSKNSAPISATSRLKSAHAMKEKLRDSLNLTLHLAPPLTEPEPEPDLDKMTFPLPPTSDPQEEKDGDLGLWTEEDEENMNVDGDEGGHPRARCNSGASVATIKGSKPGKRLAIKPRAVSAKKKGLKRCHSSRNIKLEVDLESDLGGHNSAVRNLDSQDGFADVEGKSVVSRTPTAGDGDASVWSAKSPAIKALIADDAEEADPGFLTRVSGLLMGDLQPHDRFDVSIKVKAKHIVMWDVDLDHTYVLEGLVYVKDAKPHSSQYPLKPINSLTINWRTVDSRRGTPSIADPNLYETSYRGGAALIKRAHVLGSLNPANGIHTDIAWTYLAPGVRGTGLGGGWALRFWVPVPMWLFKGREVVSSLVNANVVFGDGDRASWKEHSGTVEVTIEHLRRGREMRH